MIPDVLLSLLAILAACVTGIAVWHRRRDVLSARYLTREARDDLAADDDRHAREAREVHINKSK
jgi:hypothetical protein